MAKQYESSEFGTVTESTLGDLSRAALTRLYNEITGEDRKPASTKAQCLNRVLEVLPEAEAESEPLRPVRRITSEEFGVIENEADLQALTRQQLARLHSEITGESTKVVGTKAELFLRVVEAISKARTNEDVAKAGSDRDPQPKRGKKAKSETPTRRSPLNLPAANEQKPVRAETKRARTLAMLGRKGGATIEQVMEEIGWDRRTAMDGIRLLNTYCGYGLVEGEDGRIRAVTA